MTQDPVRVYTWSQKHLQAVVDILQDHLARLEAMLTQQMQGIDVRLTRIESTVLQKEPPESQQP